MLLSTSVPLIAKARRWSQGVGFAAVGALLLIGTVACSDDDSGAEDATEFSGVLAEPESADTAYTYAGAAPAGAEMTVEVAEGEDTTNFALDSTGFEPDRGYAIHAHVDPCGTTGDDAGPHYQEEVDPAATPEEPSADPTYANPENEVWLDLSTDDEGAGTSEAEMPFAFGEEAPASIVVHEEMETATGPGEEGRAGGRLACLDTPLR
ncbi:hypothetical protein BH24ACT3_BH24ACT3_16670 [soil metagenome]